MLLLSSFYPQTLMVRMTLAGAPVTGLAFDAPIVAGLVTPYGPSAFDVSPGSAGDWVEVDGPGFYGQGYYVLTIDETFSLGSNDGALALRVTAPGADAFAEIGFSTASGGLLNQNIVNVGTTAANAASSIIDVLNLVEADYEIVGGTLILRDSNDHSTILATYNLKDKSGSATTDGPYYQRVKA